jgi:type II secretion system protein G
MRKGGFTLIELLVVVAIIAILVSVGMVSYSGIQQRGRDTTRKTDLESVASALETYYADNGAYPAASSGRIDCGGALTWGTSALTCGGKTYLSKLPGDPKAPPRVQYCYESSSNQTYNLYTDLENQNDLARLSTPVNCGGSAGTPYDFLVKNP